MSDPSLARCHLRRKGRKKKKDSQRENVFKTSENNEKVLRLNCKNREKVLSLREGEKCGTEVADSSDSRALELVVLLTRVR